MSRQSRCGSRSLAVSHNFAPCLCPMQTYVRLKPPETTHGYTYNTSTGLKINEKDFNFMNGVISGDQVDTFNEGHMEQLLTSFIDGYDVNLLAYGQTGTGKTHTFVGPPGLMESAANGNFGTEIIPEYGIAPRALFYLVDKLVELNAVPNGRKYTLYASAVELQYQPLDLLYGKCPIFIDKTSNPIQMYGQTTICLGTRGDTLRLFAGLATRNSKSTRMNEASSRTHMFVTLTLASSGDKGRTMRLSRMQFVDMSGSERLVDAHGETNFRTKDKGTEEIYRMFEGVCTNYSLMMLSQAARHVVAAKDPSKVSFNAYIHNLVKLLGGSLNGHAYTVLFITLSQEPSHVHYSLNGMDFGEVMSCIRLSPKQQSSLRVNNEITAAQAVIADADAAIGRGVKGKYMETRLALRRRAKDRLEMISFIKSCNRVSFGPHVTWQCPHTRFHHELRGEWDATCAQQERMMESYDMKKEAEKPITTQRREVTKEFAMLGRLKSNRLFVDQQRVSEMFIDTTVYGGDNKRLKVLVHESDSQPSSSPAIIYFHGGGCVVASASDYSNTGLMARFAVEYKAKVFNVDYRLAPEHKIPTQITDGAAAIRHVSSNAEMLGIDPSRVVVCGDSGGAYVSSGACMLLAENDESDKVKLHVAISPMTGRTLLSRTAKDLDEVWPGMRLDLYKIQIKMIREMMRSKKGKYPRYYAYPNEMSSELAAMMPPTVIMTQEFDYLRLDAEELAMKLHGAGRLVDLIVHPSTTHCWFLDFGHKKSDVFWNDMSVVMNGAIGI